MLLCILGFCEFQFRILTGVQSWEDEREMIRRGDLDYEKVLKRELNRVEKVQQELSELKDTDY